MGYINQNYLPITTTSSLWHRSYQKKTINQLYYTRRPIQRPFACLLYLSHNTIHWWALFCSFVYNFLSLCFDFCVVLTQKITMVRIPVIIHSFFCNEIFNKSFLFLLSFNQIYWHLYSFSTTTFNNI